MERYGVHLLPLWERDEMAEGIEKKGSSRFRPPGDTVNRYCIFPEPPIPIKKARIGARALSWGPDRRAAMRLNIVGRRTAPS